jgi:photosystem II stability/assembly factor-like uncharacterized protein
VLPFFLCDQVIAQETIYMSVLSSRKHRLNVSDNPLVGLFVSTDAGATWNHRGWREYIRTFYGEAASDGTVWLACGNGVMRSTDGGMRWRITTGWQITEVMKISVDPKSPSTVYAATAYGIFKTSNTGESWEQTNIGLALPFTSDVLVDRSNSMRVFAATEEGVYASPDGGKTWGMAGLKGKGVRTLAQDPVDPRILLAGTEEDGIFRSDDGGRSWKKKNRGLRHQTVYAIAFHPNHPSRVYVGTHDGGVYVTTDRGERWDQRIQGMKNLVVHSLCVLPSNPNIVFAGTLNGGLCRSVDGGLNWEFNSQEEGQVWGLSVR